MKGSGALPLRGGAAQMKTMTGAERRERAQLAAFAMHDKRRRREAEAAEAARVAALPPPIPGPRWLARLVTAG